MDILISSNLERLLYLLFGYERSSSFMKSLVETGKYALSAGELTEVGKVFSGYYTDEGATEQVLRQMWEEHHYLCDPHTAVAIGAAEQYERDYGAKRKLLIASTASPYKFALDVYRSLFSETLSGGLAAQALLQERTGIPIPSPLADIGERTIRFSDIIQTSDMADAVLRFAAKGA